MFSIIPITDIMNNNKISLIKYILYLLASIYACNQEQMAMIIFIVYGIFILYCITNKKTIKSISIIIFAISILSLIFIITCPGNSSRMEIETINSNMDFSNLSIFKKIENGISSMMYYITTLYRTIFIVFAGTIAYYIIKKYKKLKYIILGLIPIALTIGKTAFIYILFQNISKIVLMFGYVIETNFLENFCNIYIDILIIVSMFIDVYLLFKTNKSKEETLNPFIPLGILFLGMVSRLIIGLTPTTCTTDERTSIFWYVSIIIVLILIINKYFKSERECANVLKIYSLALITTFMAMI